MSDEESFVILGTSPMPSLEPVSLESDTPGSYFSSLKDSQLQDLQNARETLIQTPTELNSVKSASEPLSLLSNGQNTEKPNATKKNSQISQTRPEKPMSEMQANSLNKYMYMRSTDRTLWLPPTPQELTEKSNDITNKSTDMDIEPQMSRSMKKTTTNQKSTDLDIEPQMSCSMKKTEVIKLYQVQKNTDEELALSLEDCAITSPFNSINQQKEVLSVSQEKEASTLNPTNMEKTNNACNGHRTESSASGNNSLASSFIMGEINADVLKVSVYSQFPSISLNSSAEDVVKLQNMVTENIQLKAILEKVNSTMRFFHSSSLQWQEKMSNMETKHKQELDDCQKEIDMLRKENKTLQENLKTQIEAIEVARQKDREETIQVISEKSSLVENMRAEIVKLEKQQRASFDKKQTDFDNYYISRDEHNLKIKELERQLSELLASNLDLKDIDKQYIDELNFLKVNLAAAEELIKANHNTIAQLQVQDQQRLEKIKELEKIIENLRLECAEQNERILLLEQQNEVHRKDFEIEQEGRSVAVKEKQQILQDLRNLQKHNQELIAEHQKFVDNYEKHLTSLKSAPDQSFVSAAAAAQTYFNNPQRPIRVSSNLPSSSSNSQAVSSNEILHSCPICNKAFKSLSILQNHVNDCIDRS